MSKLTTREKVKSYLGIISTENDNLFDVLVASISAWIESYIGRKIVESTLTEYHNGGNANIYLKNYPVAEIDTIKQNNGTQNTPDWQVVPADSYTVNKQNGIVQYSGVFAQGLQNIEVIYSGGYASIPADLEMLATRLVTSAFEQRRAQGKNMESLDGLRIDWSSDLDFIQKQTLDNYRRIKV